MGPSMICVFHLFNVFFTVIGLFLSGIGVMLAFFPGIMWAKVYADVKENAGTGYTIPSSASDFGDISFFLDIGLSLLVLGGLMATASFVAFLGAQCSKTCCKKLLVVYVVLLVILCLFEMIVGAMLYVTESPLHAKVKSGFKSQIEDAYQEDGADSFSKSLNVVQQYYDCCGMDNADDFGVKGHASCDSAHENQGCYTKLQTFFHTDLFPVGLAALCLLQTLSVYCAVFLYKLTHSSDNKVTPISYGRHGDRENDSPGVRAVTDF